MKISFKRPRRNTDQQHIRRNRFLCRPPLSAKGVAVLARWENGDNLLTLVQSPYGLKFSLIAVSKKLDGLAQAAVVSGTRLDEEEAPQRLKAEQLRIQDDLEKARLASVSRFRP